MMFCLSLYQFNLPIFVLAIVTELSIVWPSSLKLEFGRFFTKNFNVVLKM